MQSFASRRDMERLRRAAESICRDISGNLSPPLGELLVVITGGSWANRNVRVREAVSRRNQCWSS